MNPSSALPTPRYRCEYWLKWAAGAAGARRRLAGRPCPPWDEEAGAQPCWSPPPPSGRWWAPPTSATSSAASRTWPMNKRFAIRGGHTPKDVVVVAVDDATLRDLKHLWPLPRRFHGQVIEI